MNFVRDLCMGILAGSAIVVFITGVTVVLIHEIRKPKPPRMGWQIDETPLPVPHLDSVAAAAYRRALEGILRYEEGLPGPNQDDVVLEWARGALETTPIGAEPEPEVVACPACDGNGCRWCTGSGKVLP